MNGTVTLRGAPFQETLHCTPQGTTSADYNAEAYQSELFPLHSPLLGESWLVSFPPLNNMLKFSGYSCLIGGMKGGVCVIAETTYARVQNKSSFTIRRCVFTHTLPVYCYISAHV